MGLTRLQQTIPETQPIIVERAIATLPATTATPYFTVSGREWESISDDGFLENV